MKVGKQLAELFYRKFFMIDADGRPLNDSLFDFISVADSSTDGMPSKKEVAKFLRLMANQLEDEMLNAGDKVTIIGGGGNSNETYYILEFVRLPSSESQTGAMLIDFEGQFKIKNIIGPIAVEHLKKVE